MSSEETNNTNDALAQLGLFDIDQIDTDAILGFVTMHGVKFLTALAIFIIGKWVVRRAVNLVKRALAHADIDPTLVGFLGNILFGIGFAMVVIAALAQMGIETTSLAALIASAGLAIGLALQGSLGNFASGVLIILFGFFKKDDYITAGGQSGTVRDISIFTTTLTTPDNVEVIIPNSQITTDAILNYTAMPTRRMDLTIGVAYDADLQKTQEILFKVISEEPRFLADPAPQVEVMTLNDSSVDFVFRPWVKSEDYWSTRFDTLKKIKIELDKGGIGIPFPQRDIHLFVNDSSEAVDIVKGKKKAS